MINPRILADRHVQSILFGVLAGAMIATSFAVEGPAMPLGIDGFFSLCAGLSFSVGQGWEACPTLPPYTDFTPLYPVLIGVQLWAGLDMISAAANLGVLFAFISAYCFSRILGLALGSPLVFLLGSFTMAVMPPILLWNTVADTNSGLVAFTALTLLLLFHYLRNEVGVIWVALAASACIMQRYVGIGIGAFAGLAVLGPWTPRPFPHRFRDAAVLAVVTLGPLVAWMVRNHQISGCVTGCTHDSLFLAQPMSWSRLLFDTFDALGSWLFYLPSMTGVRMPLTVVLAAALAAAWGLRRHARPGSLKLWGMGCGQVFIFCVMMLALGKLMSQEMEPRYFLPVVPPLWLALCWSLDAGLAALGGRLRRWAAIGGAVLWVLWLVPPTHSAWATMWHLHGWFAEGPGATSRVVRNSEFVAYLKTSLPENGVFVAPGRTQNFVLIHTSRALQIKPPGRLLPGEVMVWVRTNHPNYVGLPETVIDPPPGAIQLHNSRFGEVWKMP